MNHNIFAVSCSQSLLVPMEREAGYIFDILSTAVGEREVSSIGRGMCVLLGISRHDTQREAEWM